MLQPFPLINRWCQITIIFVRSSTEMKYVEYKKFVTVGYVGIEALRFVNQYANLICAYEHLYIFQATLAIG